MASLSPKKPPPLSYGGSSPRASPFRRAESPSVIRSGHSPSASPSRQSNSPTVTPSSLSYNNTNNVYARSSTPTQSKSHGDTFSRVNSAQLQEMRESFHVLDRDGDGQVTRDDIADMLNQLGQDSSPTSLATFSTSNMTLPSYLNTLSTLLAPLSSREELLAAFSAFDVDDSGQIDVVELREALVHTALEDGSFISTSDTNAVLSDFTSRRAFAKGMAGMDVGKRGDVFRYQDFIATLLGGSGKNAGNASGDTSQASAKMASVRA